ncbi:hypothetical protein [Phascolarctobacterium faecium]|uniref:hypothetical protein n=1 Tax=Phascolarctobacterium faecium TaxID=33025 RepID=UPI002FDCD24F
MTKVKICGLKRKEDIEFANILLPEYAGFVLRPVQGRFRPSKLQNCGQNWI